MTFEGSPNKKSQAEVYTPPSRRNGSDTKFSSPDESKSFEQGAFRGSRYGNKRRGRGRGGRGNRGGYRGFLYR